MGRAAAAEIDRTRQPVTGDAADVGGGLNRAPPIGGYDRPKTNKR
jgi:hypothetical protein